MNKSDDDFDLPEYHADPLPVPHVIVQAEDLHLGPAEVKKINNDWWMKEYGPKPPGPGILALDFLILILGSICFWIIIVSWQYVFS